MSNLIRFGEGDRRRTPGSITSIGARSGADRVETVERRRAVGLEDLIERS